MLVNLDVWGSLDDAKLGDKDGNDFAEGCALLKDVSIVKSTILHWLPSLSQPQLAWFILQGVHQHSRQLQSSSPL